MSWPRASLFPLLVVAACGPLLSSACGPKAPPVAAGASPGEWLPAGTTLVVAYPPGRNVMLTALEGLGVPCVDALLGDVGASWQIQRAPGSGSTVVVDSTASRKDVEACAESVASVADPDVMLTGLDVERDGLVTTFRLPGGGEQVLAFPPGRMLWSASRAELDAVLAGPRLAPDDPLAALLPELAGDGMQGVSTLDYASMFTGVPSTGMVITATSAEDGPPTLSTRLLFATPAQAEELVTVLGDLAASRGVDPYMRRIATALQARAEGASVWIRLEQVMVDPELMEWLVPRLETLAPVP